MANSRSREGARPNRRWLVCSMATVNRTADRPQTTPMTIVRIEKELILAQSQLLRARDDGLAHRGSAPCWRPMRASA